MSCVVYTCHHLADLAPGQTQRGTIDIQAFRSQLDWFGRLGIRFIPMRQLHAWLTGDGALPRRAAVLTFDDAYDSVYEHAFPVLARRGIPFTVFVIAGLIGGVSHFYAGRGGQPRRHLDDRQLISMIESGLVEVGAHGYHHLDLTSARGAALAKELAEAKIHLEDTFKVKIPYLAYPYGNVNETVKQQARHAGYQLAFTTVKSKLVSSNVDRLALPRVNWGRRAGLFKLGKYYLIPWLRSAG